MNSTSTGFQFQPGDIVEYKDEKCEAVVKDVLDRGVDILRRTGRSKGIPRFVQPDKLELIRRPRAPKATSVELLAVDQPVESPVEVEPQAIAGDPGDVVEVVVADTEQPEPDATAEPESKGEQQLSLLGI